MISNKVKSILAATGHTQIEYADRLNIKVQSLSNKMTRNSFSIHDLTVLAELCGAKLVMELPDNIQILFNTDD